MKENVAQSIQDAKERITRRLDGVRRAGDSGSPVFVAPKVCYEVGGRASGLAMGGIGAVQNFVKKIGLAAAIDKDLHLLKVHKPYHESDHVLNIAFNALCGGKVIEDIELMRKDESFLDSLGAATMPGASTAGDFCRRFATEDIEKLMDVFNAKRKEVWATQPESFFSVAKVDADGSLLSTTGETKQGMDISYKGTWGYHPLLVSLANTREPLFIANRSGNVASHQGAAAYFDKAIDLLTDAKFRKILLRGDTDFSLTAHFDRWDGQGVKFVFGYDARQGLIESAELFEDDDWERLQRRAIKEFDEAQRQRPENVKDAVIIQRGFARIELKSEDVLEFLYRPGKCAKDYRIVVVRKNLTTSEYGKPLFDHHRYFFYITNDDSLGMYDVVKESCERCNQENLIEQHKNGFHAFSTPLNTLEANWAWMVMTSLAWSLKAWMALTLSAADRAQAQEGDEADLLLRMEFRTFINAFMRIPAQLVKTGRRVIFRLLGWNPWQHAFFRFLDCLQ